MPESINARGGDVAATERARHCVRRAADEAAVGTFAKFRDPDGNTFVLSSS